MIEILKKNTVTSESSSDFLHILLFYMFILKSKKKSTHNNS